MCLTNEQKRGFSEKGFVIVRSLFDASEVHSLQEESRRLLAIEHLTDRNNLRTQYRNQIDGTLGFSRLDPVVDISASLRAVASDSRIVDSVRKLMSDDVVLFKDKLILKPPGQTGYALHQDYAWWQFAPPEDICSVLIALEAAKEANGPVVFFPGYHKRLLTPDSEERGLNELEVAGLGLSEANMVELDEGDAVIFHSLTLHGSAANRSAQSR